MDPADRQVPAPRLDAQSTRATRWNSKPQALGASRHAEDPQLPLARVLVENSINLAWILQTDWIARLDGYDVVYFEASACVHSTVSSLYGHMADLDDHEYRLLPSRRCARVERTLLVANMAMLLSLGAPDDRMGFGLGEQWQAI